MDEMQNRDIAQGHPLQLVWVRYPAEYQLSCIFSKPFVFVPLQGLC